MMVHEFDLLRWWFGDASRVYASGLAVDQPNADYAQAVVRFASGVIAHVEASWAHAAFRTTIEVAGERGILRHDSDLTNPLRMDMKAIDASGPRVSFRKADPGEPWRTQLAHFVDRLEDGAPFLVSGHDGARAVDMALAARDSIASGQPVTFVDGRSQGTRRFGVRFGVLGFAHVHAPGYTACIAGLDEADLVAIADDDPARLRRCRGPVRCRRSCKRRRAAAPRRYRCGPRHG